MRLDHLLSKEEKRSRGYFAVELSGRLPEGGKNWKAEEKITEKMLVAMRLWETPVPIPNTMVKT